MHTNICLILFQALKTEKNELQNKVAELKQDLCIYQQGQSPQVAAATCTVPELYKTFEEKQEEPVNLHVELNQLVIIVFSIVFFIWEKSILLIKLLLQHCYSFP